MRRHPVLVVSHTKRPDTGLRIHKKPGSTILGYRFSAIEFEVEVDAEVLAWVNAEVSPRLVKTERPIAPGSNVFTTTDCSALDAACVE